MKVILTCLSLLGLVSVGCGEDDCGASAPRTVDTFVPSNQTVTCQNRRSFDVGDETVSLTIVHYGSQRDCPSGCFNATVCAIEDDAGVHLLYGAWNDPTEAPQGLPMSCAGGGRETWPTCETPGLAHPLTATTEFAEFARAEYGSGPFRHCINRYVGAGRRFGEP